MTPEEAVKIIANYQTPEELRKNADSEYGLDYEEALEMAYENILNTAKMAVKRKKAVPNKKTIKKEKPKIRYGIGECGRGWN